MGWAVLKCSVENMSLSLLHGDVARMHTQEGTCLTKLVHSTVAVISLDSGKSVRRSKAVASSYN